MPAKETEQPLPFPISQQSSQIIPEEQKHSQTHNTANKIQILFHQLYFTLTIRSCPFVSNHFVKSPICDVKSIHPLDPGSHPP